jgi:hypothetical protein
VYAFKKEGDKFYAQKTDLVSPYECGVPPAKQQEPGFVGRLKEEKEATRAASWIPTNPWIRQANDPPFDTQSFCPCVHDDNWTLGQAFFRGDLCFVQQVDGGDEWLAIKQDMPFESISFRRIIQTQGAKRRGSCSAGYGMRASRSAGSWIITRWTPSLASVDCIRP